MNALTKHLLSTSITFLDVLSKSSKALTISAVDKTFVKVTVLHLKNWQQVAQAMLKEWVFHSAHNCINETKIIWNSPK